MLDIFFLIFTEFTDEPPHYHFFLFRQRKHLRQPYVVGETADTANEEEVVQRDSAPYEFVLHVPGVKPNEVVKFQKIRNVRRFIFERPDNVPHAVFEPFVSELVFFQSLNEDAYVLLREAEKLRQGRQLFETFFCVESLILVKREGFKRCPLCLFIVKPRTKRRAPQTYLFFVCYNFPHILLHSFCRLRIPNRTWRPICVGCLR